MYQQAEASYWKAEDIDLSRDIVDWDIKLDEDERFFLSRILSFFAEVDVIVKANILDRLTSEVQMPEARCFYRAQQRMCVRYCPSSSIHSHFKQGKYTLRTILHHDDVSDKRS